MTSSLIALKVDVDTYAGTRDGVPRLLTILGSLGIHATFYFSMGPDNSGKAIRRIFTRKGFLKKMLRTKAPSTYGLRTLLYGTFLPAPRIAGSFPDVLKRTLQAGNEVGIHCWDHVHWHDHLPKMRMDEVCGEFEKSCSLFLEIFGQRAATTAAPGWTVSADSLELQDTLGLCYCSDSRGYAPFYPVFGGRRFSTLQIPTTLPTADELLGSEGITTKNINDYYLSLIKPGLNVHTIHAEMEGGFLSDAFTDLLRRLLQGGARFCCLRDVAQSAYAAMPPDCVLAMGEISGRAGAVAVQGERIR